MRQAELAAIYPQYLVVFSRASTRCARSDGMRPLLLKRRGMGKITIVGKEGHRNDP